MIIPFMAENHVGKLVLNTFKYTEIIVIIQSRLQECFLWEPTEAQLGWPRS